MGLDALLQRKSLLWLYTVVFILLEIPFSQAWLKEQGGILGTHFHFWHQTLHDPLYQVTLIDFGATAGLVYLWMIQDSVRQGHPRRCWYWLPLFLFSPSIGLLGYLLNRRTSPALQA